MAKRSKPLTDPPEELSVEERRALLAWLQREIAERRLPREFGAKPKRRELLDACLDWHRSNGKQRCDWPATVRNWIRNAARFDRERRQDKRDQYRYEHPQEERGMESSGELQLIYGGKR